MPTSRPYALVLFGATGFTGGLTARYLSRHLPAGTPWALAGRDRAKLERVAAGLDGDADAPALLQADSGDPLSLAELAAQTRAVATTVGPYVRYGEPLVRACVEHGTHYCDLTGEPEFVNTLIPRYHEAAQKPAAPSSTAAVSIPFPTTPAPCSPSASWKKPTAAGSTPR